MSHPKRHCLDPLLGGAPGTDSRCGMCEACLEDIDEPHCVAGCCQFTGGEVKHHKDCPHYPESLSRMYDETTDELSELRKMHNLILAGNEECPCCFGDLTDLKKHADASPTCPISVLAKHKVES